MEDVHTLHSVALCWKQSLIDGGEMLRQILLCSTVSDKYIFLSVVFSFIYFSFEWLCVIYCSFLSSTWLFMMVSSFHVNLKS